MQRNTVARKNPGTLGYCFMDRPMKLGERIYVHVANIDNKWLATMDLGLTNKSPESFFHGFEKERKGLFQSSLNNEFCLCLNKDSTLSISINSFEHKEIRLSNVSLTLPVWLVIYLYRKISEIKISNKPIQRWHDMGNFIEYF